MQKVALNKDGDDKGEAFIYRIYITAQFVPGGLAAGSRALTAMALIQFPCRERTQPLRG